MHVPGDAGAAAGCGGSGAGTPDMVQEQRTKNYQCFRTIFAADMILLLLLAVAAVAALRVVLVLPRRIFGEKAGASAWKRARPSKTLVVIGSGA